MKTREQRHSLGHERCLSQEDADLDTDYAPSVRLWHMVGKHSYANA